MSDDDYSRYLHGVADRSIADPYRKKSDIEIASQIIKAASLESTGGEIIAKKRALNEAEYSLMPDFYTDVVIRNNNATYENRAIHPFSQSWDSALTMVGNAFKQVGVMAADVTDSDVATVEGQTVKLSTMGGVTVNGAKVVAADVAASNGVIHAIDAVILPPGVDVTKLLKK